MKEPHPIDLAKSTDSKNFEKFCKKLEERYDLKRISKQKELDIIRKDNKIRVKMHCTDCNKEFYREISLEGSCEECHKIFVKKVEDRIQKWRDQGIPERWYDKFSAMIEVLAEEVKEEENENKLK